MIKEEKTIFISVLIVLFLAFSNFLSTGDLIFTFPVNDYLLLVITVLFTFQNNKHKIASFLAIFFVLLQLFSQVYNLEFFLNQEQLTSYANSILPDIFQLLSSVIFIALLFHFFKSTNKNILYFFGLIFILLIDLFFNFNFLILLAYIFTSVLMFINNQKSKEKYYDIYLLHLLNTFLFATKLYTIYFN